MGRLRVLFDRYQSLLKAHPYRTNMGTSAVLMFLGDQYAQFQERHLVHTGVEMTAGGLIKTDKPRTNKQVSFARTGVMCSFTVFFSSPFFTAWFLRADTLFKGSSFRVQVVKACATVIFVGMPSNAAFFTYSTIVEHYVLPLKDRTDSPIEDPAKLMAESVWDEVAEKLSARLLPTTKAACGFWIPANLVAFLVVPKDYRVVFTSGLATVWSAFLSFMQHRGYIEKKKH
eukprot:gb/GEZN01014618.1/.p1 GENE.gb/GEZN01014618.1/~~gb/GEZN01014618.1/.p1  ORF type:complete len:229 (+),score=33.56 gb/GEZN01014618.1/:22-708(+)